MIRFESVTKFALRMINRMIDPTSGRILLDDRDIATIKPFRLRLSSAGLR